MTPALTDVTPLVSFDVESGPVVKTDLPREGLGGLGADHAGTVISGRPPITIRVHPTTPSVS
jgi:hypothetical protein